MKPPDARVKELDGARGIAILLVLLTHLFCFSMMARPWTGFAKLVLVATKPGWLGVDLFFVLSGFLITGVLLDLQGDAHYFRDFYGRRALRILPLYLLALLALALFYKASGPFVGISLLLSSNLAALFGVAVPSGGMALWSLAIEEHFYLLWPWVVRFTNRRALTLVAAAICVAEPIVRAISRHAVDDVYFYSWFRFDGLAWGALLALYVRSTGYDRRSAGKLALMGVAGSMAVAIAGRPFGILHRANALGAGLQFTVAQIFFAALILFAAAFSGSWHTAILRTRILTWSGDLSYCLYVTHLMLMDAFDWALRQCGLDVATRLGDFRFIGARAAAVLVLCYALASLSRRFLELPILRWKRVLA